MRARSADVAVWNGDDEGNPTLLAHLSVLFAGRDIFLAPLRRKPEFLGGILRKVPLETLNVEKMGPSAYKAQLDAIISAYGEAMLKELPVKQNSPAVKEFLAIQELGLCGIAFYSGLLVGRLIQTGAYASEPGKRIPMYVGGNGSKLLRWCALGRFSPTSEIYRQMSRSLLAGVTVGAPGLAGSTVEIVLSELPKEEVAFGLVARHRPLEISEDFTNPLAGEKFRVIVKGSQNGNGEKEWNESPDAASLRGATVRVDPGLPVFRQFLKSIKVPVSDDEFYDVSDTVNTGISEIADQFKALTDEYAEEGQLDSVRKEPMFIMALKHLVSQRIDKWVGGV